MPEKLFSLSHAIYDVLPRGTDGEAIQKAISAHLSAEMDRVHAAVLQAARARAINGSVTLADLETLLRDHLAFDQRTEG